MTLHKQEGGGEGASATAICPENKSVTLIPLLVKWNCKLPLHSLSSCRYYELFPYLPERKFLATNSGQLTVFILHLPQIDHPKTFFIFGNRVGFVIVKVKILDQERRPFPYSLCRSSRTVGNCRGFL